MEQVEEICQQIVLVNKGRNILNGKVSDIKQQYKSNRYRIRYNGDMPSHLIEDVQILDQDATSFVFASQTVSEANRLLSHLVANGVEVVNFEEILPTLNDIFIQAVSE